MFLVTNTHKNNFLALVLKKLKFKQHTVGRKLIALLELIPTVLC